MCKSHNHRVIDKCLRSEIEMLNALHIKTLACCCGHGIYPKIIVVKHKKGAFEMESQKEIPRKKRFYVKDKKGYYYIPETLKKAKR